MFSSQGTQLQLLLLIHGYSMYANQTMSSDTELDPGVHSPSSTANESSFLCYLCNLWCTWEGSGAIACDNCSTWFHKSCMKPVEDLDSTCMSHASWICNFCGVSNYSTNLFDGCLLDLTSSYNSLSDTDDSMQEPVPLSPSSSIGSPSYASSPKQNSCNSRRNKSTLKVITVNFQRIRSKKEVFWDLLDSSKPDVIIGCETWLKPDVANGVIIPPGYETYRHDQPDGYDDQLQSETTC